MNTFLLYEKVSQIAPAILQRFSEACKLKAPQEDFEIAEYFFHDRHHVARPFILELAKDLQDKFKRLWPITQHGLLGKLPDSRVLHLHVGSMSR